MNEWNEQRGMLVPNGHFITQDVLLRHAAEWVEH